MPRAPFLCLMIVAAFPLRLSAAGPAVVMAPVPAATLAVARTLGMAPELDRGRFLVEAVRLLHGGPESRTAPIDELRRADSAQRTPPEGDVLRVPVPLDPEVWSAAVFKRRVAVEHLVDAILLDRRAALLAAGLAALDDETLEYLGSRPATLTVVHERSAAIFAAFGASLRVRDGRVVPPGGEGAIPLWEAVVGAPVTAPERFVPLLYSLGGGRVAYVYDTINDLDPAAAAFALGASIPDAALRLDRFRALIAAAVRQYREWKPEALPYSRPLSDLGLLLMRLRFDEAGQLLPPMDRAFWAEVWGDAPSRASAEGSAPTGAGDEGGGDRSVDAAWLVEATSTGNMFERGDRLDQVAFAQRVFAGADAASLADAASAVRVFPRQRMLMLTLERMGVRAPALYGFLSRQVSRIDVSDGNRAFWVVAPLQSALALVARMTRAGSIDLRTAESLMRSVVSVPFDERGRYAGGLARWLVRDLVPRLPQATDVESSLMLAMAGPLAGDRAPRVDWEGTSYRLDLAYAEQHRLNDVREKQGGYTVDLALDLLRVADALNAPGLDGDALDKIADNLAGIAAVRGAELDATFDVLPPGVSAPRRGREAIGRVAAELSQAVRARDARRAARQAGPLLEFVDIALGEALLSLAYAADIGDPLGTALLARNVALRHDLGFGMHDTDVRARTMWAVPRQDFQPGIPWHVTGSVLGLDIALARLSLTRINSDRLGDAPRLPSIERDGFAVGLALMDPLPLTDAARDAVSSALAAGRRRIDALAARREPLEPIASVLRLDGVRRRAVRLAIDEEPSRVADLFSLGELVALGGLNPETDLDPWGVSALQLSGCPCTRFVLPGTWRLLAGRPQVAFAAAAMPDLNLRIADVLAELRLPAALIRPVLAAAIQDFVEDAAPSDGGDWWALSHAARAVPRERVEDYVAAVASIDGALVPDDAEQPEETREVER